VWRGVVWMKGSWNVVWGLSVWIGGTIADREREGEKGSFITCGIGISETNCDDRDSEKGEIK